MNPILLLAALYNVTEEDALAAWEAFENSPWARKPVERMDAVEVAHQVASATAFPTPFVAEVLVATLKLFKSEKNITTRFLVEHWNRCSNLGDYTLSERISRCAVFAGIAKP